MKRSIITTLQHVRYASSSVCSGELYRTALYDWHLAQGGKMVEFAGYALPVQYDGFGVLKEHLHTRKEGSCSLFDVSHMGQIRWTGKDVVPFLEKMTVGDIAGLKTSESKLSLIMNANGGIEDDTVISNAGNYIYMVVNGACKQKDINHFEKYKGDYSDLHMDHMEDQQLLALQGKASQVVLERISPGLELSQMPFMTTTEAKLAGINCRLTRCGYTGEDGFEISVGYNKAVELATILADNAEVQPAGLGARDSLRLEAGLCLYGQDLTDTVNPVEAGLVWTIGGPKSRRRLEQGFLGAETFLEPNGKLKKMNRKRVGIAGFKSPARADTQICAADGTTEIGVITSGVFGPSCKAPIAMGYVSTNYPGADSPDVKLMIRGKAVTAQIVKMPFVPANYHRIP